MMIRDEVSRKRMKKRSNGGKRRLKSIEKASVFKALKNILYNSKYRKISASMNFLKDNMKYTLEIEKQYESDIESEIAPDGYINEEEEEGCSCEISNLSSLVSE